MPELPEVETVRADVASKYVGRKLARVTVTGRRTVRRHPPELLKALEGHVLSSVGRRGKYLLFNWDDGQVMVAHLRMSGQMLAAKPGDPLAPHTHAVLSFKGAGELRFVDPRTFGEFFLAGPEELAHLGPDALDIDVAQLRAAFAGRKAKVKSLLVDQTALAGIGNIYADEILFQARVRPDRPGGSLNGAELKRLAEATRSVLASAVAGRGSSLADQQYRDLHGEGGRYQLEHKVYGRLGQPCVTCGRPIERAHFGAKSAYFCRSCQR
jgi:formamidopyrimidine-DNA glycosylase